MFFRPLLFHLAPSSGRLYDFLGRNVLTDEYYDWWTGTREQLIRWHREKLVRLDVNFAQSEALMELIRLRAEARKDGINSGDPRYPNLHDVTSVR